MAGAVAFGLALAVLGGVAIAADVKRVLVLYENNRLLPANIEGDRGLNDAIAASGRVVDVSAEFLDYPTFGGEDYDRTVATYLRDKYRSAPPDVVVIAGTGALDFMLAHRRDLFPSTPVVYIGIDKDFVDKLSLPADFYGVPVQFDGFGTIAQALSWHPGRRRLVIVTGRSEEERAWVERLAAQLAPLKDRLASVDYLSGLATAELKRRVADLPPDAIIFTTGYYRDGDGKPFTPRQAAAEIASAASVPVYAPYNTFVGTGVVGGRVPTFYAMGEVGGGIVNQLLAGGTVAELGLPAVMPTTLSLDWRQVKRWGIDERRIPPDALVQFREPGFWDQYRTPALAALGVVLLQSALVTGLLIERRRRHKAELSVDRHRFELAHAARLAVAGELTASIAHEINQPLGAIQSNVAAAALLLGAEPRPAELKPILDDVRRDSMRASDVIKQLRRLMEKHEAERLPVEINDALADVQTIIRAEARRRRIELVISPSSMPIRVMGDRIQLQQVLINLVLNGMDAIDADRDGRREVSIAAGIESGRAEITVTDTGHGIASGDQAKLFDSFFSTKPNGIGLGLSIVRTLVEAHGGTVSAANRAEGGAAFRVILPLAEDAASVREVA